MPDTYTKKCELCGEDFDWVPGTDVICDDCLEDPQLIEKIENNQSLNY